MTGIDDTHRKLPLIIKKTEADLLCLPYVTLQDEEQHLLLVALEVPYSKRKSPAQKKKIIEKVLSLWCFKITKEIYVNGLDIR